MSNIHVDSILSDGARRRALYRGEIFVYSPTPATQTLCRLARDMLVEAFAPNDPRTIDRHLSMESCAQILSKLKPSFIHHPECKKILPEIIVGRGADPEKVYFDVPRIRSAYPSNYLTSGIAYAFHPHRDTWYSAPMCQLNWWLPIYNIVSENCLAFYPQYFDKPLANDSEIYNYYEWNRVNRAIAAQYVKSDTREQPKLQEPIESHDLRILCPPGGLIIFSGAHLHETVPNTSGVARYSIDFRTVHLDDVAAYIGAPNVDSRCTGTTMRDYLRCSDLERLPDAIIRTYDDGTEVRGGPLVFQGGTD